MNLISIPDIKEDEVFNMKRDTKRIDWDFHHKNARFASFYILQENGAGYILTENSEFLVQE